MSGMDDLAAFLAARYDEAEAMAKAAEPDWDAEYAMYEWNDLPDAAFAHARSLSPAHRLADIKLKRAILAEHPHCRVDYSMTLRTDLDEPFGCSTCDWDRDYGQGGEGWCATVRQLGTEFSDHPDYKPGWRPDDTAAAAP